MGCCANKVHYALIANVFDADPLMSRFVFLYTVPVAESIHGRNVHCEYAGVLLHSGLPRLECSSIYPNQCRRKLRHIELRDSTSNQITMGTISLTSRILLQNVVLATDFSESSTAAVSYAASIARNYHGKLFVVHVIPPEMYPSALPESRPSGELSIQQWVETQMQALLTSEALRNVSHEGIVKQGEVWDSLQEVVYRYNVDAIVTGTRGRRGAKKLIMGSVAEEILRLSPVPVLAVRPDIPDGRDQLRTILHPSDFSGDSMGALAYALSLAQEFQSQMILLHVAPVVSNDPEVRNRLQTFFADQLRQIIPAETSLWSQQQLVVELGDPTDAILRCAEVYKADLIVMGVRGAGSMARASTHFGSTAYRVITDSRAPVLSVRKKQENVRF